MSFVFLYACEATFEGNPDRDYDSPKGGETVDCALCLRHEAEIPDEAEAERVLRAYGLGKCKDLTGHLIDKSMLASSMFSDLADQYHDALNNGQSLSWDAIE